MPGRHRKPGRRGKLPAFMLLVLAVSVGFVLLAGNWSPASAARPVALTVAVDSVAQTPAAAHAVPAKPVVVHKMVGTKKGTPSPSRTTTVHAHSKHTVKHSHHHRRHHCRHHHHRNHERR